MHRCNWNRQTRQMQNPLRLLLPLWRKCLIYPGVRQLNMYVPPRCPSDFSDRTSGVRLKNINAGVMELADVTDSKSVGLITRVGSSPTTGTRIQWLAYPTISRVCGLFLIFKYPSCFRTVIVFRVKSIAFHSSSTTSISGVLHFRSCLQKAPYLCYTIKN